MESPQYLGQIHIERISIIKIILSCVNFGAPMTDYKDYIFTQVS